MLEVFDRYRKAIITGGGVLIFLFAGLLTMLLTGPENVPSIKEPVPQSQPKSQPSEIPSVKTPQPPKNLYVYITGEIRKPGVYKLSDDARIFQLVEMAGGFTSKADTESLNLAETLADGVHVHIGAKLQAPQEKAPRIPGMPASKSSAVVQSGIQPQSSGLININTATASELESLPGIGPAIAQRIIEYRNAHGNFSRPEDLINVRGIGKSKLAQALPHISANASVSRVAQPKSSAGLIDINRATAKELERLPGVGTATAKRIVEYRQKNGAFTKPEDLMNIRGIGYAKLEKMRSLILIR